jgi:hypothetical protein
MSSGHFPMSSSRVYPRLSHAWRLTSVKCGSGQSFKKSVRGLVDECAEPGLALAQSVLSTFALGDFDARADEADRPAVAVPDDHPAR